MRPAQGAYLQSQQKSVHIKHQKFMDQAVLQVDKMTSAHTRTKPESDQRSLSPSLTEDRRHVTAPGMPHTTAVSSLAREGGAPGGGGGGRCGGGGWVGVDRAPTLPAVTLAAWASWA